MALFRKKKEEKETSCCCCGTTQTSDNSNACCSTETDNICCGRKTDSICCIKVLGAGCKSCHEQYENAKKAAAEMGLNVEVEYITDMEKVMAYGVMSMPALVVNEKVVSMGKVLKPADVERLLKKLGF